MSRLTGGSSYELRWLRACSLVVAVGIGIGLLLWPLWSVAAQTIVPFGLACMLQASTAPNEVRRVGAPRPTWRLVVARAFVMGGMLPAGRAFADLSVPLAALVVGLAALSSPPVLVWVSRVCRGMAAPSADPETAARLRAWIISGHALGKATTDADRLAVVERRQSMLDAWEELDPAGFNALLDALPSQRHEIFRGLVDDD